MKSIKQKAIAVTMALLFIGEGLHAACSVTATNLNFGTYDTASSSETTGTGNVNVHCSGLLSIIAQYTVTLSWGGSGTYSPRKMQRDATYSLEYNLYKDSAYGTVWGDGTDSTGVNTGSVLQILFPYDQNFPVYGKIPPLQNVPAGSYSDTITATMEY